jgi:hypothetical protein
MGWLEEEVRSIRVVRSGVAAAMALLGALHAIAFVWVFEGNMDSVPLRFGFLCLGIVSVVTHTHAFWLILKEIDHSFFRLAATLDVFHFSFS